MPQANTAQDDRLHILLVEDNLVNQRILAKQLRTAKYNVTVANHGVEALSVLQKTNPRPNNVCCTEHPEDQADQQRVDVVLMDIEMPVMGGLLCTRKIRQLEDEVGFAARLPIIAVPNPWAKSYRVQDIR